MTELEKNTVELPQNIVEILEKYNETINSVPVTYAPYPMPQVMPKDIKNMYEDYKMILPYIQTLAENEIYIDVFRYLHSAAQMHCLLSNNKPKENQP